MRRVASARSTARSQGESVNERGGEEVGQRREVEAEQCCLEGDRHPAVAVEEAAQAGAEASSAGGRGAGEHARHHRGAVALAELVGGTRLG